MYDENVFFRKSINNAISYRKRDKRAMMEKQKKRREEQRREKNEAANRDRTEITSSVDEEVNADSPSLLEQGSH